MAASGTLQARAFASNAQLPLPGVAIRITERTPEGSMKPVSYTHLTLPTT